MLESFFSLSLHDDLRCVFFFGQSRYEYIQWIRLFLNLHPAIFSLGTLTLYWIFYGIEVSMSTLSQVYWCTRKSKWICGCSVLMDVRKAIPNNTDHASIIEHWESRRLRLIELYREVHLWNLYNYNGISSTILLKMISYEILMYMYMTN